MRENSNGCEISWDREWDRILKPKFANQLCKIMSVIQEELVSHLVMSNFESNITNGGPSSI